MSTERYIKGVDIDDNVVNDILLPPDNGQVWDVFTAGMVISGYRVCYFGNDDKIYTASHLDSPTISKSLVMTNHSAGIDEQVKGVLSGKITNQGWGLTPGARYFLSSGGNITTTPPTNGYLFEVGVADTSNTLILNFTRPIIRN